MKLIPSGITRVIGRHILTVKQNSPTLFFAGGVVGVVGGTVLACRATLNLHETLDTIHEEIDLVKAQPVETSEEESAVQKQLVIAYLNGTYQITKMYAPAVLITGVSIAALTGSHVMLSRRNAAITAAYAGIARSYDEYRDRVRVAVGDDKEIELYHAVDWQEVEGSDGKILEPVADSGKWSPYTRFFDRTNHNWTNSPEVNRQFIECQQRFANHRLQAEGFVMLNDVYRDLGLKPTPEGQLLGWWYDPDDEGDGDNYIDFGVYEAVNAEHIATGAKDVVLDFNVDGIMYHKIDKK
jgi:hypothetical protein